MAIRVLLIESFPDNICDKLAVLLQKEFETHFVITHQNCIEAVRNSPPDVVLMLTNNIRDINPFELAKAIRSVHAGCGFVFLAGSDSDGRETFLAEGHKFHIRDIPLPLPELVAAIKEAAKSPADTFVIP